MKISIVAFAVGCLGLTAPAGAAEVYFNGVKVSGIKNQSFAQCAVRFDSQGNVHITAKGYSVERVETPAGGQRDTPNAAPNRKELNKYKYKYKYKYFLVYQTNAPGKLQYDVAIYLDGRLVRRLHDTTAKVVMDVSKYLTKADTPVRFVATKNYRGQPRASTAASDYLRVFIGQGGVDGGQVTIRRKLAELSLTAAQTEDKVEQLKLQPRQP